MNHNSRLNPGNIILAKESETWLCGIFSGLERETAGQTFANLPLCTTVLYFGTYSAESVPYSENTIRPIIFDAVCNISN